MNTNAEFIQMEMSKLFEYLQHLNSLEKPVDYDISVDDLLVVPRTNLIENFDKYKPFLRDTSLCVKVRIYHSKSRGYKQYSYKTPYANQNEHLQQFDQKNDRLKMSYVNAVSKERFTEYKYKEMKRKNKNLKRQNEALQAEITQLRASGANNSMFDNLSGVLAPILSGRLSKAGGALAGVENDEVSKVMNMVQQKLTEEEFDKVMGINISFTQYKGLINDVNALINQNYRK